MKEKNMHKNPHSEQIRPPGSHADGARRRSAIRQNGDGQLHFAPAVVDASGGNRLKEGTWKRNNETQIASEKTAAAVAGGRDMRQKTGDPGVTRTNPEQGASLEV